ncbi:MAG: dependent oxidoreductase [Gammaproteobacteria bacterium]|nr:dependent oxidoreductase [Gammaproteobacteria bacterium]
MPTHGRDVNANSSQSLWAATAAPGPELGRLAGEQRAQVTIIGGGYTGLSTALHLAEAGRAAVVLEAADVGERASGLNGGQVIPGVKYDPDTLEEMFGTELGRRLVETVARGPDLVFELIRKYEIACDAVRKGWIQPATSEAALGGLRSRVEQWHRRGAPVAMLTREETARLTGSSRYCGGWIDRRGGTVQPLSYVRGLAFAALRNGSRIFQQSPATKLSRSAGEWRVETPLGSVTSPVVVLATDAYADQVVDVVRRTIVTVPSFQVATAPLSSELLRSILPERQSASDTWHLLRYFRLDATGRLCMGSRGMFGNAPLAVQARHHYRAVREIYPQLDGVPYDYHWGGLVAITRDHLPRLQEVAPGLLAGFGYNGRGVAMATMMGSLLARWSSGQPAEELGFPVTEVDPLPLHGFSQFGARVTVQYLRTLDGLARMREKLAASRRTA